MADRSARDAVAASIHRLQLAVSCVSTAVLRPSSHGHHGRLKVHALVLNDGESAPLRRARGKRRLRLGVSVQYRIVEDAGPGGPWKVRTAAYMYTIETDDGQEVIAFHWHPDTQSPTTYPHVHMGSAIIRPDGVLDHKVHVPTGRVALQKVIRLAIDLGAKPIRDDWRDVLERTEEPVA